MTQFINFNMNVSWNFVFSIMIFKVSSKHLILDFKVLKWLQLGSLLIKPCWTHLHLNVFIISCSANKFYRKVINLNNQWFLVKIACGTHLNLAQNQFSVIFLQFLWKAYTTLSYCLKGHVRNHFFRQIIRSICLKVDLWVQ